MSEILVSVIIPTYNRANLIRETIDSIVAQTYKNWECIIVDDGSTDNTAELINRYSELDSRFKYFKRPENRPKGGNACRNYGFERSSGAFINWFDSDDIMLPDFIKEKVDLLVNSDCDSSVCYGAYFEFDKSKIDIAKPNMDSRFYLMDFITNNMFLSIAGPMWKRDFLKGKNLFDENRQKIQDVEFHFRMLLNNVKLAFFDSNYLFLIRRGEDRVSASNTLNKEKLIDVFLYHYTTFAHSNQVEGNYRTSYSKFTARKTLRSYYEICLVTESFSDRLANFIKFKKQLYSVLECVQDDFLVKIRYAMGLFFTTVFRKGFKFFE